MRKMVGQPCVEVSFLSHLIPIFHFLLPPFPPKTPVRSTNFFPHNTYLIRNIQEKKVPQKY